MSVYLLCILGGFIAETIAGLDYQGFISHEWSPAAGHEKLASIRKSMEIIDV